MARGRKRTPTAEEAQAPLLVVAPTSSERVPTRSVDDMSGDVLKQYARSIGIGQRDIDGLSESRLRQNCKARIFEALED